MRLQQHQDKVCVFNLSLSSLTYYTEGLQSIRHRSLLAYFVLLGGSLGSLLCAFVVVLYLCGQYASICDHFNP